MSNSAMADYHRQNERDYCGSAAALMVLSDADVGIPYSDLDQGRIFREAHRHSPAGWAIHPDGLIHVLNTFENQFVVSSRKNRDRAMGDIAAALDQHGIGPAVLLGGGWHWVMVNQLETEVIQGELMVKAVIIHDPWSPNALPPPQHEANDRCRCRKNGHPDKRYSAKKWRNMFLRCACNPNNLQQHDYVSVIRRLGQDSDSLKSFIPEPAWNNAQAVDGDLVLERFFEIVERFRMTDSLPAGIEPSAPRFVEYRTVNGPGDYYLVSLRRGNRIVGMACIGAATGDLISIQQLASEAEAEKVFGLPELRDGGARSVIDYISKAGRSRDILGSLGRLPDLEDKVSISETLLWRSCPESRSEYLPFWRVTGAGVTVYIRLDGEVFPALTTGRLGE